MSALISFLGGSAFRAIWGELAGYFKAKQEHAFELERMAIEAKQAAEAHARQMEMAAQQAALGIKTIQVKSDADQAMEDAKAFATAMESADRKTGVKWVDAWNGCIRPAAATISLALWMTAMYAADFKVTDWDKELVSVILGFYFANRVLGRK